MPIPPKLSKVSESIDISLLNDVLGFAVIVGQSTRDTEEALVVHLHDCSECTRVARQGAANQFHILGIATVIAPVKACVGHNKFM